MSYKLHVEETSGFLHVQITGPNNADVVAAYMREVLAICANHRCKGLLVEENLTGPGLPLAQIYRVVSEGSHSALAHQLTVAFVNLNPRHPGGNAAFAETVARNRGIDLRSFRDVQEAQAWLNQALTGPTRDISSPAPGP